jgi:hypothetical protein
MRFSLDFPSRAFRSASAHLRVQEIRLRRRFSFSVKVCKLAIFSKLECRVKAGSQAEAAGAGNENSFEA